MWSGDPTLGPLATLVFAIRVLTSEDILLRSRFLVMCPYAGRPMPTSGHWGPDLTSRLVWAWTSMFHIHSGAKVCFGGRPTPPTLGSLCIGS